MSRKKKNPQTTTGDTNRPALTIGSRVRCTDDGVQGRIVWANAASVKIQWDDGEQVTWRRDSLASRPLQILDAGTAAPESPQTEQPPAQPEAEQATPEQAIQPQVPRTEPEATPTAAEQGTAIDAPAVEPVATAPEQAEATAPTAGPSDGEPAPTSPAKPRRQRQAPAEPKDRKLSAIDAAAKVLQEVGTAMSCPEMIDAMAARGYWTSPAGKTPAATLCSAILRELTTKGEQARFVKTQRGKFAHNPGT
jgi:hypothetical protein